MEILYTNCAGLDVHKKTVKVCVLTQASTRQPHKEFRTYSTTTEELLNVHFGNKRVISLPFLC